MTYQEDGLAEACKKIVPQLLVERGWGLVEDEAAFVAQVLEETQKRLARMLPTSLRHRPLVKVIEDATVNRYSHIWHTACGANDTTQQQQAFAELYQYLYPIALSRANHNLDIAEESTQEALIIIFQKLNQVRDPGAFVRYASMIVGHKVSRKLRLELRRRDKEISESELPHSDSKAVELETDQIRNRLDALPSSQQPNYTEDRRFELEEVIKHCLRRSKRQQTVIIKRLLEEKTIKEVAEELGMTPTSVGVLRHRGAKTLRECKKFQALAKEWGI